MSPQQTQSPDSKIPSSRLRIGVRQDRQLVPILGGRRYIVVDLVAPTITRQPDQFRAPVAIGLVIDRSGSMGGPKIDVAKKAALEVIDRLHDGDEISLTIFDTEIDVLLPRARVDGALRNRFRALVNQITDRGGTALHEGWLKGCRAIADQLEGSVVEIKRCFLLTDGQANSGVTDPAQIARDVAAARAEFGVITSTFGIGNYDEDILAPMATAGGGQFHNLRTVEEISTTFLGELGEAFSVAARAVTIEIEHGLQRQPEVVSGQWVRSGRRHGRIADVPDGVASIDVGDLISDEHRHVAVALDLVPRSGEATSAPVRIRATWRVVGEDVVVESDWIDASWSYAEAETCEAEHVEESVARDAGQHLIEQYVYRASRSSRDADFAAVRSLQVEAEETLRVFSASACVSDEAVRLTDRLRALSVEALDQMGAKEALSTSLRMRSGRRDLR